MGVTIFPARIGKPLQEYCRSTLHCCRGTLALVPLSPHVVFQISGVDLFSLTGWIPERIFFPRSLADIRDFETEPERAWDRLYSASSFGDCLITVSTTRELTETEAESLGLVTGHAYAVLEVFQACDGTRLLQMKNPWASKSWTGKYSAQDLESWKNFTLRAELSYNPDLALKHDDGIFWISWDDVLRYFQNIQLSWNPGLFQHSAITHDFWPVKQGPENDTFNIGRILSIFWSSAMQRFQNRRLCGSCCRGMLPSRNRKELTFTTS